jgi:hypothetical protein
MNEPKLRARLKRAELRLGDVAQTVPMFSGETLFTARIHIKLDYYTSTPAQAHRRLASIFGLKYTLGVRFRFTNWVESFFLLHVYDHPSYNLPEAVPVWLQLNWTAESRIPATQACNDWPKPTPRLAT